jgi:hypothetical protein
MSPSRHACLATPIPLVSTCCCIDSFKKPSFSSASRAWSKTVCSSCLSLSRNCRFWDRSSFDWATAPVRAGGGGVEK